MPQLPAPHVTVEELSAGNLDDYILAATDSFAEISEAAVESLKALARNEVAKPNPSALSFLARYKGLPAGFGRLRILRDGGLVAGYIGGGGVRPCFRHRPVIRMVCRLATELQRRGIGLMLAHGNVKTSAGILKKLGFRAYREQRYYTFR
jgi:ribosomal protein S18 acetylase RimI-like enzyme